MINGPVSSEPQKTHQLAHKTRRKLCTSDLKTVFTSTSLQLKYNSIYYRIPCIVFFIIDLIILFQNPKDKNNSTLLPVMVFIYGGGFKFGQSNQSIYGPDYLLEHGVIVVSFNYRVGAFGKNKSYPLREQF